MVCQLLPQNTSHTPTISLQPASHQLNSQKFYECNFQRSLADMSMYTATQRQVTVYACCEREQHPATLHLEQNYRQANPKGSNAFVELHLQTRYRTRINIFNSSQEHRQIHLDLDAE